MREERNLHWVPKTRLGKEVFEGKIVSIDEIFKSGRKIKEPQIVDRLLPNMQSEIIFIGGSPGKGGGSKKTPTKRTARMHRSGRRYNVIAVAVVGNGDGYFGVGKDESLEHREAIRKATENAKINIIPVRRGCGSWECGCSGKHSIPFAVDGKEGSVTVRLKPAPKGIGLCINKEAKKIMRLVGISDIWSKSFGETRTRVNVVIAMFNAFKKMNRMKMTDEEMPKPAADAVTEDDAVEATALEKIESDEKPKKIKKAKKKAKKKDEEIILKEETSGEGE